MASPFYTPFIIQTCRETLHLCKLSVTSHPFFEYETVSNYSKIIRGILIDISNMDNPFIGGRNLFICILNYFITNLFQQLNYKACEDLYETYPPKIEKELQRCIPNDISTYCYYRGRLLLYSEKYDEALELLSRSYANCDPQASHNRARILYYLIPLEMNKGRLPPLSLLREYHFEFYEKVRESLLSGNLQLFISTVEANRRTINQRGICLLISQIRLRVCARLVLRCALTYGKPIVPYAIMQSGFRLHGIELSDEELSRMANSLQVSSLIKCYTSLNNRMVVFSKSYFPQSS
ncbi:hypothetical protein AV274_4526 [Blastocystis sp. ATCC 50177/Nand II]|nr:hypothetical protein AV274_4526 [Blastocystis sp. ATCC 50177/Nand II]